MPLYLLGRTESQQRGRRPSQCNRIVGQLHSRGGQFLVNDHLFEDVGSLAPGSRETGLHITGPGQLLRTGIGMIGKPVANPQASGIIGSSEREVHR